ncbi:HAT family dimerization domain-containing protein [Mycena sanguinolenta]|uniref:HAT family dimerization domain-containing protein n=1 Tax=Mycena sanguinolenta TaxID=230812 RepID=A0A8H6YHQ1_9AGAR|nr:HAT family dimerization domain-containing protein [Mycena sanguinolenta]
MCIYDGVAHGEFSSQCLPAEEEVLKVLQTILLELRPQHNLCPVLSVHVELLLVQTKPHRHLLLQCRQGGGEANHNRHRQRMPLGRSESHWSTLSVETTLKKRNLARPRDVFDDDGHPGTPNPDPHVHFHDHDGHDEYFPEPSPTPSTPSPNPSPTRQFNSLRRHRQSPRAGPHVSPLPQPRRKGASRSASAKDVWAFFEPKERQSTQKRECLFCKQQNSANPHVGTTKFSTNTSTGVLRKHLYEHHLAAWVEGCDRMKIPITAKEAAPHVEQYRIRKNQKTSSTSTQEPGRQRTQFSQEAFVDAIVEWIVSDDQSLNVVENQQLRNIFLMLRSELKDSDIPHRTKIRQRVMEIWDEHLDKLESEMALAVSFKSFQLGWVTLDNASNNDTFMTWLEIELQKRKIPFRKLHRRIRCFPHIVNLAVKAVLSAITNMDFAAPEAEDFVPNPTAPQTVLDAIARDPIATVRTTIRASSLRRQYFSEVLKALQKKDLQLLRDVDTRWSSTLIMIERAILLREAIDKFLSDNQFQDLHKYKLNDKEWEALAVFKRILAVPHAFQQLLSAEGTPTLGDALPSFEAMISRWEEQKYQYPETAHIVQQGIDKLKAYRQRVEDVPAYILSMRELNHSSMRSSLTGLQSSIPL